MTNDNGHIIVFGNEKGGSGKSTAAMHVAITLIRLGYDVGAIDLDARQGTLTRYMSNRFEFVKRTRTSTPMPSHMAIARSENLSVEKQREEEKNFFDLALSELQALCDFVVVDTPGTDNYLSRLAHRCADTLLTPLNDSFVDLDLLAELDPDNHNILGPSIYTKMVSEQRSLKMEEEGSDIDWIVMRNRLIHIDAKNKRDIGELLRRMSVLFDFRLAPGFGERVIFKELFLKGLTLMDMREDPELPLTLSQISSRQEVRQLVMAIGPDKIKGHRKPPKEFESCPISC
jgi:chromosome partitioning protein